MTTQPEKPTTPTKTRRRHTRWMLLRTARRLERAAEVLAERGEGNQATQLRLSAAQYRKQAMRSRWF